MTTTEASWAGALERAARWAVRHWLLCVNALALLYAGVPFLAPLATCAGHPLVGAVLFRIYTTLCHQRPERSFFVCGHQVAFCHRCTAMYGGIALLGLLFHLVRRHVAPAPLWLGAALMLPILLDGGTHMLDDLLGTALRSGGDAVGTPNFWLRIITGALFALALLVTLYPRLERGLRAAAAPAHGATLA